MTQEEQKELLLRDLCARYPYVVKVECNNNLYRFVGIQSFNIVTLVNDDENNAFTTAGIKYIKPYLIPLSSMTVEQRCKVQNLLPNHCDISFKNQKITFYDEGNIQLEQLEKVFNFFNMHHIDYRGLIPMGLAIEAPEGMYN